MTDAEILLGADEPAPFAVLGVVPSRPVLLVCDHASHRVPARLSSLGVSAADLKTHLGVDIGAGAVVRFLSSALRLPAVLAGYSRLVVDCNRRLDDPSAFPAFVDGVTVPGNRGLSHEERSARADALYWPYHHAVRDQLGRLESLASAPALITVHSFTPVLNGARRPWHFGVLWDKDSRIPAPLMEGLRRFPDVLVGDNQPYSGRDPHDFTIDHHGEAEGLPHVSIEIRQDLVETDDGVRHWGGLLAEVLAPILAGNELYTFWTS